MSLNNSSDYKHAQYGLNFRLDGINFPKMSDLYMSLLDDVMSLLLLPRLRLMFSRKVALPLVTNVS